MTDFNMIITIISIIVTFISITIAIKTSYDRKLIRDGLKDLYDAKLLDLRKIKIDEDKLALERKKHEARMNWKKLDFGIKLLNLLFPQEEEVIEEYEEEIVE